MHFTLRAVTCSLCGLNSTYETTAQHCKTVPSTQNTLPPPLFAKPARYSLESPKAQMPNFCVSNIPFQILLLYLCVIYYKLSVSPTNP